MKRIVLCLMITALLITNYPVQANNQQQQYDQFALINIWKGHTSIIDGLVISPDGQTVASWDEDYTVRLWNAQTGEQQAVLQGHRDKILGLTFSPDSKWLASRSNDLILWNADTGTLKAVLQKDASYLSSAVFTPDSRTLVSIDIDYSLGNKKGSSVRIWDVTSGKLRANLVDQEDYELSPDGTLLATADDPYHQKAHLWHLATGEEIATFDCGVIGCARGVTFSPDGSALLIYDAWEMQLWDTAAVKKKGTFVIENYDEGGIYYAVFTPDQQTIISAHNHAAIVLWDVATEKPITTLERFTGQIQRMFLTPDGKSLIAHNNSDYENPDIDSEVLVWNFENWQQTATMSGHTSRIRSVVLSLDGKTLLTTGEDNTIRLWDMATGKEKQQLIALSRRAYFNGSHIISASGKVITVYGIPDSDHPVLPYVFVPGTIMSSAVHVRTEPSAESKVLGYALEGKVMVGGLNATRDYAFLPEYGGWVRFAPDYLTVTNVDWLPTLGSSE